MSVVMNLLLAYLLFELVEGVIYSIRFFEFLTGTWF